MKKNLLLIAVMIMIVSTVSAQEFPKMDASPMDAAYYPNRAAFRAFAKTEEEKKAGEPKIRVLYSRPQAKEREVFGNLVKYGEVWRIGANESTEVLFYQDVTIGGTKVKAGRYTIYATAQENEWEVLLSSDKDGWGQYAFKPEESTVAKITVPTKKTPETLEALAIVFEKADGGANMIIGWENTMVSVPIMF